MRIKCKTFGLLVAATLCLAALPSSSQQQSANTRNRLAPSTSRARNETSSLASRLRTNSSAIRERAATTGGNNNGRLNDFVEDELPADFYEMPPEQLDLGANATGRAPTPMLNVVVLQNGQMIDSTVNVQPGTPLEMVIYLDDKSAKVYGLLVSYLKVKDDTARQREEELILNGCSIDSYIFGNFELNPEDQSLRARFRAFKFPDSNFVRFVGTVNVCIKQCPETNCGGGGAGTRKKRHSTQANKSAKDDRLVFTVSTTLRIGNNKSDLIRVR